MGTKESTGAADCCFAVEGSCRPFTITTGPTPRCASIPVHDRPRGCRGCPFDVSNPSRTLTEPNELQLVSATVTNHFLRMRYHYSFTNLCTLSPTLTKYSPSVNPLTSIVNRSPSLSPSKIISPTILNISNRPIMPDSMFNTPLLGLG